jgi:glycosyltransferase involved in cell wall biosynthesis
MTWALIVATIDRIRPVEALLASLAGQTDSQGAPRRDLRVILVDQNADGRLDAILEQMAARIPIDHVRIPSRGVSHARNAGLDRLRDEAFVCFPDDDSFLDPLTIAHAEAALAADVGHGVVIGNLHLPEAAASPGPAHDPLLLTRPSRYGLLRSAGMPMQFYRRSAVTAAGRFDESLGPGGGTPWLCGEDSDYLLAAVTAGQLAVRSPAVRVFHPPVDATSGPPEKAFGYGRGRIRVLRKHGYPAWFILASVLHPLLGCLRGPGQARSFRWHLARGRLRELLAPHRQATS